MRAELRARSNLEAQRLSIGTDSTYSWSGSAGNKSLYVCVVSAGRRIANRLQYGFWLRLNRLGSLPLVRADFDLVLAGKWWRAKVIVMACCSLQMSQQAAVLRRTHVYIHVHSTCTRTMCV